MEITRRDREALDELLGFFDDCKDLTEEHVSAMLVILAEHRQMAVAALTKERDGLREALREVLRHLGHNQCEHPTLVRKGAIWTCCEDCGMEWADDRGGFRPYVEPEWLTKAYAALSQAKGGE